jgi:very-short-patch-repair endonuclease
VRAYLDGYWEEAWLALEVDDWESHGDRRAQERDRQRDRWLLTAHGIVTIRVTPREIRDNPDTVVADLARAYRQQLMK